MSRREYIKLDSSGEFIESLSKPAEDRDEVVSPRTVSPDLIYTIDAQEDLEGLDL